MNDTFLQRTEDSCRSLFGITFDALLAPIDAAAPGGKSVRANGVYHAIAQARLADDKSLPMGAWERELKCADWDKVSKMAVDALAYQSKDLQLAAWLLEAQINKNGFAGIASVLRLMQQVCECYWDDLYPQDDNGNLEHRANIFRWINEKLLSALRLVPITQTGNGRQYGYADWERARRNEQLRKTQSQPSTGEAEDASASELSSAMAMTPVDTYSAMEQDLSDALSAMKALSNTIGARFGRQAPSIAAFGDVLEQIRPLLELELTRRGVRRTPSLPLPMSTTSQAAAAQPALPVEPSAVPAPIDGSIHDRADAYARLSEAANFLLRLEPHSPVPYLVRRAAEWGQLNAVELYQEVFLRMGGQLNIFEMLGLERPGIDQAGH